ncbi:DUF4886 domain-containing protein [Robertkochia solimangrovi]|uniref:DUF4886 domain-containing protein n=1 Tax=Robertkochia solimangrovi TaxID=2213046 RepID=UPI001F54C4AE|nr:DUF4886 domain-containing protein [Robertkochia solimangrovi]
MRQFKIFLLLLFLVPITSKAQTESTKRVLLVGNSFTYFWNMPQMVNAMALLDKYPMDVRQSTVGGATWEEHYNEKRGTQTRRLLKEEKWDYVVIQDHSLSTLEAPDRFEEYGSKLTETIRKSGAKPCLMMTWAYSSNPLMQDEITTKYRELAQKLQSDIIPVGELFMKARKLRPDLNFYFDDKHPSSEGSYLIALIMYKALTGNSVREVPDRLYSRDAYGEELILSFIHHETGEFLRQLVEETAFNGNLSKE